MPVRPFRITLLIHALTGGGAERQICNLANHLSVNGMVCTLITLDSQANDRFTVGARVARVGLDAMKSNQSVFAALAANQKRIHLLRAAIRASQPDCVISFCDKMNVLVLAACSPLPIPVIISERSDPRKQKLGWMWEVARRWLYPNCSACVAQSKGVADYLRRIIGNNKVIAVIPSAIELPSPPLTPKVFESKQPSKLLYVGRLSHEKGPDHLLQAWSTLASKYPSWKLTFVGDGPLESQLQQFCRDHSMQQQVEFAGWKDNVWEQYFDADAFVLPSRYEGFPGVLIEAMYARLPVVATDCSDAIREMIDHERTGFIADKTLTSLVEALDRLLGNARLREQLGGAANQRANNYLWSQVGTRWINVIQQVIQTKS